MYNRHVEGLLYRFVIPTRCWAVWCSLWFLDDVCRCEVRSHRLDMATPFVNLVSLLLVSLATAIASEVTSG
jgi:hypothetical protein